MDGPSNSALRVALPALLALLAVPATAVAQGWDDDAPAVEVRGFAETLVSSRVIDNDTQSNDFVMAEARFQLELAHESRYESVSIRLDAVGDAVTNDVAFDLREASIQTAPTHWLELVIGRQTLTWGTGDLVFLNDIFPKDYVSFFSGRAPEYLKAPSTAVRLKLYPGPLDIDIVWSPIFEADRGITGTRLSYFSPQAGVIVGEGAAFSPLRPAAELDNGMGALRVSGWAGSWELAAYGHVGFTPQPTAFDASLGRPTYARIASGGASVRVPVGRALLNTEGVYYHSIDDPEGDDPFTPNSQARALVGLERELVANFTVGLQYYAELNLQYDELRASSPTRRYEPDEIEHSASLRLTGRLLRGDLVLSLFALGSPTREDLYVTPSIDWRATDALRIAVGANVMWGAEEHTLFGQLQDDTNAWIRARYAF